MTELYRFKSEMMYEDRSELSNIKYQLFIPMPTNILIQSETRREIKPSEKVRELSVKLVESENLRTLDALQLASAPVWCFEKPKGKIFVCCDDKLSEAAEKSGFIVLPK